MPVETWTPERIELLKENWDRGKTGSQIAALLGGVSRNAVIGKVHRLKLASHAVVLTPEQQVAAAERSSQLKRERVRRSYLNAKARSGLLPRFKPPKPILMEVKSVVESRKLSLMDLTLDTCRWPTNEDMQNAEFCGHPVTPRDGRPFYCAHHQWVASPRSQIACDSPPAPIIRDRSGFGDLRVA